MRTITSLKGVKPTQIASVTVRLTVF